MGDSAVIHWVHYTDREIEQNMEGVKNFLETCFNSNESSEAEQKGTETERNESVDAEANLVICPTETKSEICKFFLENKCRFGDQCRNIHEGEPMQKSSMKNKRNQRKQGETRCEKNKKKPPMKTADDVIKRLQWDPMLPKEYFVIGYIDRFLGVVEENFTTFCWEDLASVDYDVLAIPQHRIQYFKYKSEKVWDKTERLDIVFGSTGSNIGIMDFMEEVDKKIREERENFVHEDEYDSDFEDQEPAIAFEVNIVNNVHQIAEEERSSHFIAVKISNEDIVKNILKVQNKIIENEEILQDCCMKKGLLHITLAMLRIKGEEGIEEARKLMRTIKPKLTEILADKNKAVLKIEKLKTFGHRVVYADVIPTCSQLFYQLVNMVRQSVENSSDLLNITNSFDFVPHLTVAKVSRPVARERRSKYIDSSYYQEFQEERFGEQALDNLQLCVIDSSTRYDGFYNTLAELQF